MMKGSNPVDNLIDGLERDTITTLYGPPGSGKSTVCLEYVSTAIDSGKRVFFIDTEGGFSPERVQQINPDIDLSRVVVFSPTSFNQQKDIIEKLNEKVREYDYEVGLIVLDSLAMLYRLKLGDAPKRVNKELAEQLRLLAEVSRGLNIPVLVTNQEYKVFDTNQRKMVGGSLVEYWSKTILEMERQNEMGEIVLKKHKYIKEGRSIKYSIEEKGLKIVAEKS